VEILFAQLINGIAVGGIYALMVTGFNLLYVVAGIIQFAYPLLVVLSMYSAWYILRITDNNVTLAILVAIVSGIVFSIITEPIFRQLTKRKALNASLIASIGLGMIITDIISHEFNIGLPVVFPKNIVGRIPVFQSGITTLFVGQLTTLIGSIVIVVIFLFILFRTQIGRAFRAIAQHPFQARLLGIPIIKISILSYVIAGILGGVSAIFLITALGTADPALGNNLGLKIMAVALFAGLGNLKGGLIAAIIIGIVESMTLGYLPGQLSSGIVFGVIMISIMIRPKGVFIK